MLLKEGRFCVIDLETTGPDSREDEIVAFAAIPMRGSRVIVHQGYYTLIKPRRCKLQSMKFHRMGIGDDLRDAPPFEEVSATIFDILKEVIVVGHCVERDYQFLRNHFTRVGTRLRMAYLDIVLIEEWLGRQCGKKYPDYMLDSLMSRYGLEGSCGHNVMADAFWMTLIFQAQMKRLADSSIDSLPALKQAILEGRRHRRRWGVRQIDQGTRCIPGGTTGS